MQVPDVRPDDAPAEDEADVATLDRELAQRLEEELREGEEPLEDDIEEQVVAANELVVSRDEDVASSDAFSSLAEPTMLAKTNGNLLGPDEEEFVCQSCFFVKRRTQLADPERVLCVDCASP